MKTSVESLVVENHNFNSPLVIFVVYKWYVFHNTALPNELFADDTCLYIEVDNGIDAAAKIKQDLPCLHDCSQEWFVKFSQPKTKVLTISNKTNTYENPPLEKNHSPIEEVNSFVYLALTFTYV